MAQSLLEAYKNRIAVSESLYSRSHNGEKLDSNRKLAIAKVLDNTAKFINESFESSMGTQRADLGEFKKFCLALTAVALPNLIANDLVIVHPMSSITGFLTYINYTAGTSKGETGQGDLFNNPFRLGDVDAKYTSESVVEVMEETAGGTGVEFMWQPVNIEKDAATGKHINIIVKDTAGNILEEGVNYNIDDSDPKHVKLTNGGVAYIYKVGYKYDNVVVPQGKLPMLNAHMESIALVAHARRIAVYYSQIAQYQAKTDYGMDLGAQLAEKAVGQLSYEIDTEITNLLVEEAKEDTRLEWSKTLPVGVNKRDHFEGFVEIVERAREIVYDATKRFAPNYMLIASDVLPILTFIQGFKAASVNDINGPYLAGTLNALKVFVTPNIDKGTFVIGVNGGDYMSSAAVYAPYMAIVPTQLLQYADGGMSQGWSTMYDLKLLNRDLIVKGKITD